MKQYIATFHTHVSALISRRTIATLGYDADLAPVPRKLSSSCGTCLFYSADDPLLRELDTDVERVYETGENNTYVLLYENE